MPNDLLKVKKIYADSKISYKFNHYVRNLKRNVLPTTLIQESILPDFFNFVDPTINPELKMVALGSENFVNGNTDSHKIAMQQKFMSAKTDYKNFEASWYLKYTSGDSPFCIYGRSTAKRSDKKPCMGMSYRAYFKPDGSVRLCKESYFGNKEFASEWKQVIAAMEADQIVGMKFICVNIEHDTAVKLELWLDELNKNDWKLVDSFTDLGNNWGSGGTKCGCTNDRQPIVWGGPVVGFCTEGASPSNTIFTFTKVTVREVNPGGVFAEARAGDAVAIATGGDAFASTSGHIPGADTGGGVGDGAGGVADDTITGTGDSNALEPLFTIQPTGGSLPTGFPFPFPPAAGTAGQTSTPVGSPSTATDATPTTGTNQTAEKPLVTVYKDIGILWNIVLDSESGCDVGSPFQIDYRQIYSVSGTDTQEIKLFNNTGGIVRVGAKAHSSASILVGNIIRKVTVPLRKFGGPSTGHLGMEIRDRLGNLMTTFDTEIDPAIVATGAFGPSYEFKHDANKHRFQAGDMLMLTYANAVDANANNCIILKGTEKDELDGFDTLEVKQEFQGTIYKVSQDKDWSAAIFI